MWRVEYHQLCFLRNQPTKRLSLPFPVVLVLDKLYRISGGTKEDHGGICPLQKYLLDPSLFPQIISNVLKLDQI